MGNCHCFVKRSLESEFNTSSSQVFSNFKECPASQHFLVQQQLNQLKQRYNLEIINYSDLIFDQVLGQSENWTTFYGFYKNLPVAIRIRWLDYNKISSYEMRLLEFLQDLERIQKIITQHPNFFVQIKGLSVDKIPIIITEYMDQKDVQQFYRSYQLSLQQKLQIAIQIAEAMACLHSYQNMSLAHGKFKPQNIVANSSQQIKICYLQTKDILNESKEESSSPITSNLFYTAPELLENNEPQQSNDIWAFGCILAEMFSEESVWKNMTVGMIYKRLFFKHSPDISSNIPIELKKIIHDCLEIDPRIRPTFRSLQQRFLKVDVENDPQYEKYKIKVTLKQVDKNKSPILQNQEQQEQQQFEIKS